MNTCLLCEKKYVYSKNHGTKKLCSYCQFLIYRIKTKERSIQYKGGMCKLCGYNKSHRGLTFHHINPEGKLFDLADNIFKPWSEIQIELDKCILLCMNCHIELHNAQDKEKINARV